MNSLKTFAVTAPLPPPQQTSPEQQEKQQPVPSAPATPAPSAPETTTSTPTEETTDTKQTTEQAKTPSKEVVASGNNSFLFGAIFVVVVAIAVIIYLKFNKKPKE